MKRLSRFLPALRLGILAATGGTLCFLGFIGFGVWPLSLIALAMLWEALEHTHRSPLWKAILLGMVFGWTAYAGGYRWLWRIVDVFLAGNVPLGAAIWLVDATWFALRFGAHAGVYQSLRRRGRSVALSAVPSLLLVEWLHPMLFPPYLGHSLGKRLVLIQISDLGGPLMTTALLALANVGFFETWRWFRSRRSCPVGVLTCAVLAYALAWAYGTLRIRQIDQAIATAPELRVAVVQGNLGVVEKNDAALVHRRYLEQTRELVGGKEIDLVVWPETVYMRGILRPLPVSGHLVRQDIPFPLLFGGASVRTETGRRLAYNSALLVGADGVIRSAYDKNLLIPFTEYVPLVERVPALAARFRRPSHFHAASDTPPVELGPWRISTPICYEAVRPGFVRRMVRAAAPHLIVTLANDAWFGDSEEPWLHLAMAGLRAVEHRRYLVRATNSGVSAIVDPSGREVVRSGLLTRENLRGTVRMLEGSTFYTRWGDWPGWVAAAVAALGLVVPRKRL